MADLPHLEVRNRQNWRDWLEEHHASSPGVWLVFYKGPAATGSVTYDDAVCEALCFGWVDSLIKRLDDHRYVRKFTPRKPTSNWSESNRKRWAEMEAAGLLAPAGLAAVPTAKAAAPRPDIPELPRYIAVALREHPPAWTAFQQLTRSCRREYVTWIHMAKRPETRARRIHDSIRMLAAGKKLGLK